MYRDSRAKKGNHPAAPGEPGSAPAQAQPFQVGRVLHALPEEGVLPSAIDTSLPQAPLSWLTPGAVSPGVGQGPLLFQYMRLTTKILLMNTEKRKVSPSFCKDFPRIVIPHGPLCHVMPCFLSCGSEFGRKKKLCISITQRYQGKPYCCVQNREVKGFAAKFSALPSPSCFQRS